MLEIRTYKCHLMVHGSCANEQVELVNALASTFERMADFAVFFERRINRYDFEHTLHLSDVFQLAFLVIGFG